METGVDLGPELEAYVADLLRTGRYRSRSDILREGVRLLEGQDQQAANLDAAIGRGIADADAGRVAPAREVAERLGAKYAKLAAGQPE